MNPKVGDKVTIRDDLENALYPLIDGTTINVNNEMVIDFRGRTATIIGIMDTRRQTFKINIDEGRWNWAPILVKPPMPNWKKRLTT